MAPHSSTLAWKIPWTEEPGELQSMGSQRVGPNWATELSCTPIIRWIQGPRAKPLWEWSCHALLWIYQPAHSPGCPLPVWLSFIAPALLEGRNYVCFISSQHLHHWWQVMNEWVNEWVYSYLKTKGQFWLAVLLIFNASFLSVNMDHQAWVYNWHLPKAEGC